MLVKYLLSGAQQVKPTGLDFNLIFICTPFLMNEDIVEALSHGNKRSNINKIFSNKVLQGQFYQTKDLIDYYQPFIKKAIILLSMTEPLNISKEVNLKKPLKNFKEFYDDYTIKHCKAAFNLGAIISKEDPLEIIIRFGV